MYIKDTYESTSYVRNFFPLIKPLLLPPLTTCLLNPPPKGQLIYLMANTAMTSVGNGGDGCRPPRLPRWTRQEILVLIQGKRVVESRGRGRASNSAIAVEPKWAAVSSYCRRHGVNRGAVQCRKRWSNLAGDYKKIKEWEMGRSVRGEAESFWGMRNDLRRERKLPGFFDREVYDILDGVSPAKGSTAVPGVMAVEEEGDGEEVVFDSGRSAADDGLFSDFEEEKEVEEDEDSEMERRTPPVEVVPISEKKLVLVQEEESTPEATGPSKVKQQPAAENSCKDSPKRESLKRRRTSDEDDEHSSSLQSQIVELLDRNNRMLAAQLESQNVNTQLDREQRKDQVDGLLVVLNKLADAIGRIADKL